MSVSSDAIPLPVTAHVSIRPTNGGNSDISTIDTISKMVEIVQSNAKLPLVVDTANKILLTSGDTLESKLTCLFNWVKGKLQFKNDEDILAEQFGLPEDKELLFTPDYIIRNNWVQGDCDDYSTLLATLIVAGNLPVNTYFVTICADTMEPNRWSHVYVAVECNGVVIPLDSSHGPYIGWETKKILKKKLWLVNERKEHMVIPGIGDVYGDMADTMDWLDASILYGDPAYATGSTVDWGRVGASAINNTFDIIKGVISQPKPGQYISHDSKGNAVNYRLPEGATGGFNISPLSASGGDTSLLIIGAIVVGAVMLMNKG